MINIPMTAPNLSAYEFAAMKACESMNIQPWEYNEDLDGIVKANCQLVAMELYKLDVLTMCLQQYK